MAMLMVVAVQLLGLFISPGKCLQQKEAGAMETISVVVDSNAKRQTDFIHIPNPPKVITDSQRLQISYHCSKNNVFGIEIISNTENHKNVRLFSKAWKCAKTKATNRKVTVVTKFPKIYLFQPDLIQRNYELLSETRVRVWMLDEWQWSTAKRQHDAFLRAFVKVGYVVEYPPPFSRQPNDFEDACVPWRSRVLLEIIQKRIPTCPYENETIDIIQFPAVMTGLPYGVIRTFQPYHDVGLEFKRQSMVHTPRMTLSVWLYVLEYCQRGLCGIVTRMNKDSTYLTPMIFLTRDGRFHIQITQPQGQDIAALTNFHVPLHQWFRFVFTLDNQMWAFTFNYGPKLNQTFETSYRVPGQISVDDTEGFLVVGGMEGRPAFRGYLGQATYFRNRIVSPIQIPFPDPLHPMFELQLSSREKKCTAFLQWTKKRHRVIKMKRQQRELERSSFNYFANIIYQRRKQLTRDTCFYLDTPVTKNFRILNGILGRYGHQDISVETMKEIGLKLFKLLEDKIDADVSSIRSIFPALKQSACLGDNDAMYLVAVILNNGFLVTADEIQGLAYLMTAALDNHRLSFLAIGNKHKYGLDTVPLDLDQAYMYFKYVADTTREDLENHKETDVLTESVRLTDDVNLREQTDEEGDVFHWWIHQAKKGVFAAQQHVARMLFWGSQGLKRNIQSAVEYYKMGMESKDPVATYDYGVLLMRGQGVKKNVSEGLSHIRKAAEQRNPAALNALGWYAMNTERNYTLAARYFEESHRQGNPDAANHLGILHLYGYYPNKTADPDLALQYFNYAAARNQFDAGIYLAYLHYKGTPRTNRSIQTAVEWARFIAEKNPNLGFVLRSALQAYRHGDTFLAILYYMEAAEAGIEVGTFNLAWLCEENKDGKTAFINKDCQWRNYNLSIHRETQFIDTFALIKMGDYYWFGCEGRRDVTKSAELYALAASKGDPQGLFNLAHILEEGVKISPEILQKIGIAKGQRESRFEILQELYSRCRDSPRTEAYIPCTVSLYRIIWTNVWRTNSILIQITGFIAVLLVTVYSICTIASHLRHIPDQNIRDIL